MLAIGGPQRIRIDVRLFEGRPREQLVDRPLLEFDGVSFAVSRDPDELFGQARLPIVVDAALGDDEAGLVVADQSSANLERTGCHQAVQPPSTMRFAPVM